MTRQDRTTLKSFFRNGALPTAEHYRDLIDSGINQVDDGFSKTPAEGLRLHSAGSALRLMSLYQGAGASRPSWVLDHGREPGVLNLRPEEGLSADEVDFGDQTRPAEGLTMTRDGRLGVNSPEPAWRLDVDGATRSDGRIGAPTPGIASVPADGDWHDITRTLTGCQAFEIMAGVGGELTQGRYSMLHAIAMNAFHPRNSILNWLFGRRKIKAQTAMYGSYADRLRLRWVAAPERHSYKLQLRANARFGKDKVIRYYITRLWFDTLMNGSRGGSGRDEGVL